MAVLDIIVNNNPDDPFNGDGGGDPMPHDIGQTSYEYFNDTTDSPSAFPLHYNGYNQAVSPISQASFDIQVGGPTFASVSTATLGAALCAGLTFQWVVEKGIFRKAFFEKANQYNVILATGNLAALLQTLGAYGNVLFHSNTGNGSLPLTIFILINWMIMTHASLMIVTRKLSLTDTNAEQAWKRLLYLNLAMMPVSIVVSAVWILSAATTTNATIPWNDILRIIEPIQTALWGILEFALSLRFIIQMAKFDWQVVENKGVAVLILVALCDMGLVLLTLLEGPLVSSCFKGFVYTLRIRMDLEVVCAMVTYIQMKRAQVVYEANKNRRLKKRKQRRRLTVSLNLKRNSHHSRDSMETIEDDNSDNSDQSTMTIFQRLPHATDFGNLFTRNFVADFTAATVKKSGNFLQNSIVGAGRKVRDFALDMDSSVHGGVNKLRKSSKTLRREFRKSIFGSGRFFTNSEELPSQIEFSDLEDDSDGDDPMDFRNLRKNIVSKKYDYYDAQSNGGPPHYDDTDAMEAAPPMEISFHADAERGPLLGDTSNMSDSLLMSPGRAGEEGHRQLRYQRPNCFHECGSWSNSSSLEIRDIRYQPEELFRPSDSVEHATDSVGPLEMSDSSEVESSASSPAIVEKKAIHSRIAAVASEVVARNAIHARTDALRRSAPERVERKAIHSRTAALRRSAPEPVERKAIHSRTAALRRSAPESVVRKAIHSRTTSRTAIHSGTDSLRRPAPEPMEQNVMDSRIAALRRSCRSHEDDEMLPTLITLPFPATDDDMEDDEDLEAAYPRFSQHDQPQHTEHHIVDEAEQAADDAIHDMEEHILKGVELFSDVPTATTASSSEIPLGLETMRCSESRVSMGKSRKSSFIRTYSDPPLDAVQQSTDGPVLAGLHLSCSVSQAYGDSTMYHCEDLEVGASGVPRDNCCEELEVGAFGIPKAMVKSSITKHPAPMLSESDLSDQQRRCALSPLRRHFTVQNPLFAGSDSSEESEEMLRALEQLEEMNCL